MATANTARGNPTIPPSSWGHPEPLLLQTFYRSPLLAAATIANLVVAEGAARQLRHHLKGLARTWAHNRRASTSSTLSGLDITTCASAKTSCPRIRVCLLRRCVWSASGLGTDRALVDAAWPACRRQALRADGSLSPQIKRCHASASLVSRAM